ncbi:MAG: N-acetylmuramoyl-L-alanine amidase [Rivularia sp. (in: cyanobacteria)]
MYFGIDIGHNCPPYDTGAVSGPHREDVLANLVGELVISKLKERSHKAVSVTPRSASSVNSSLRQRARKANWLRVDYFVSIHFNAAGSRSANGSEVFIYNYHSSARSLAQDVLDKIVSLGFRNRKVKAKSFAVLRYTNMPAILVECCFLTSDKDMRLFNAEKMATAIVDGLVGEEEKEGILGVLKVKTNTIAKPSTDQSSSINSDELYDLGIGEYKAELLADEEGHYEVKLEQKIGQRKIHYIYSQQAEFIPGGKSGTLKVKVDTVAKPSTEQSSSINPEELYDVEVGEYKAKLLAEEDLHYQVEFEQAIGQFKIHYIYSLHAEFIPDGKPGVLRVKTNTVAKPSTEQSSSIKSQELYDLEVGEYKAKFLASEEGHYKVELEQEIGDRKVHYIYSQHAEFIPE